MATSGSKTVAVVSYIDLVFEWKAGTQDTVGNYTPVTWTLKLVSKNSSARISASAAKDYSVTVNGTTKSGTNNVSVSGGATKTLASGSLNIKHDSDGGKEFDYSFSQEFAITYSGSSVGTKSGSGTGTLNTIPRGSVLGTISAFTLGNAINIPITKYASSYYDVLTIAVAGTTVKTVNGITNGYDVSFTSAELTKIYGLLPSATSANFTFKLTTKTSSSGSNVGTSSKTAKGTIPASVLPSIGVTFSEAVDGIADKFGAYIQGKSRLAVSVAAVAGSGSSIKERKTTINGSSYTGAAFTTAALKTAGSNSYSAKVVDARGRSDTATGTFNVVAYQSPTISSFKVVRCDADGTLNDMGENALVTGKATITAVSNKNDKAFKLQYKQRDASEWITAEEYTAGYTYTINKIVTDILSDEPYDFRIVATDFFGDVTKTVELSSGYTILDILADGSGIAFGKVAEESGVFDVGMNKGYLPSQTYIEGEGVSNVEKNIYFQAREDAANPHNCKVYGGNGESTTGIGMWDSGNARQIYRYLPGDASFLFGAGVEVGHGSLNYPYLYQMIKSTGVNTGNVKLSNGLLLQWGKVSITPAAANVAEKLTVNFKTAYKEKPNVFAIPQTSAPQNMSFAIGQGSDTVTSFDIYLTRTTASATSLQWFAIGEA